MELKPNVRGNSTGWGLVINDWELGLRFVKYLLALPVSSADPINFTAKSSYNTAGRTATMSGPGGKFLQETTHHIA